MCTTNQCQCLLLGIFWMSFLTLREEKIPIYIVKKYIISCITDKLKLEKLIAEKRE